ncbi:hypothetical protein E3Q18_02490 [Wallemia mellicola]|uniref:Uncharacterized protein n=1 Tax=Wallemia mellicola TaxID=1708541 RepID=A0A4T0TJ92_9BASI|nr:hypothetical protein E3Q24_02454 [Wallemia mellicola]TIB72582.1 hypothetical protein E3Q23_03322 [Wallemia mellicola]TIB83630.1 hypothetical protein E3Q21_02773 [Wallemia mellicola]TIB86558.1 hypothetical protein E3Q20_02765 [Wallemia mellicola]TIB92336.1 hypothetical protein E3Q19_01962 [Wallemia mellicola]
MTPIRKTLALLAITTTSVLASDIHPAPEVCCDSKFYTSASEAKQLVKDLRAGKVDGDHHWFENGDTIWESSVCVCTKDHSQAVILATTVLTFILTKVNAYTGRHIHGTVFSM